MIDLDINALQGATEDPHQAWLGAVGGHALKWTPRNGGHWIATSGDTVWSLYNNREHFSSWPIALPPMPEYFRLSPDGDDGADHDEARAIIMPFLSPQAVAKRSDEIRALAISLIEGFQSRGRCEFMQEFGLVLPVEIFLRVFGLPLEDRHLLRDIAEDMAHSPDPAIRDRGFGQACEYLKSRIHDRAADPGNDMISALATARFNGAPITEERALRIALNVMLGGLDTVASMLGFILAYLARNPDARTWLIQHPRKRALAIEELMRRHGLVNNLRAAKTDIVIDGALVREGEFVYLISTLHGLDQVLYPDPMKINFERSPRPNAVFGAGEHRCAGANLARLEIAIVLEEWLARIPDFRIAAGEKPVTRGGSTNTMTYLPLEWYRGDR